MTGAWRLKSNVIPKPALLQVRDLPQVRELRFLSTAALKSTDSGQWFKYHKIVNEKFDCYLNHKYYICL
jgi:hypothetical protein